MNSFQISRREFKRLGFDKLETYAENVVQNCAGKPEYKALDWLMLELQNALPVYHEALVASLDKSMSAINRKHDAREVVEDILERIAKTLEVHAQVEILITEAGMKVNSKHKTARPEYIPAPLMLTAHSTGNRGEVLILIKVENPRLVKLNAYEYSSDEGLTWMNGAYKKRSKFVLDGLPSHKQLLLRARSIGTDGRVSSWTEAIVAAVL